jgi:magnesium chelatase family protein
MYSRLCSAAVCGIDAFIVDVETHLENQIPGFVTVGLPDSAVRESRERVMAAVKNSGFPFPQKKVTINLAPADIRKEGSAFDLPIALGVLAAYDFIAAESVERIICIGELALDGSLRPVHGVLSIAVEAGKQGFARLLLPAENAAEAALVPGVDVIALNSLEEAVKYLNGHLELTPMRVELRDVFRQDDDAGRPDISDVKGQEA